MAIGWLTVLKMVPWSEVITNAPKLAEGAKKLWSAVARKPPAAELLHGNAAPGRSSDAQPIAQLQARLDTAVTEIADLHQQMLASSELIRALAEQNAQLIQRVEIHRRRVLALGGVVVALLIWAVIHLVITLAG